MKRLALSSLIAAAASEPVQYRPPAGYTGYKYQPTEVRPIVVDEIPQSKDLRSIINPDPYLPDERPEVGAPIHVLPQAGSGCKVNPWLLMAMLNHAVPATISKSSMTQIGISGTGKNTFPTKSVGLDFVMKSLMACKDNEKVKEIFSLNYLMKDKPDLYKVLNTGATDADRGYKSYKVDGARDPLVDLLGIKGTELSKWTKSKVFLNMYKWKLYNQLYSGQYQGSQGTPFVKYKYMKDKFNNLQVEQKDVRTHDSAIKTSLGEVPHWYPYIPSFINKKRATDRRPSYP